MEVPPSSIFFDGFSMKFTIQLLGYHHLWKRLRGLKMWPPHVGRVRSAQWVVRKNLPNPQSLQKPKWQVTSPFMDFNDIFMVLFSMFWLGLEKKSPTTRQLQEACFNSEEAKTEMAAISGRDPSEFKARSTSETMAKNRMWWVKCPRSPQKCVLSLCLYTYIHTDRQTDGRTDRHTYIHTYDIGLCVLCVLCMLCFYAAFNVFKRR